MELNKSLFQGSKGAGSVYSVFACIYVFVSLLGQVILGAFLEKTSVAYIAVCTCFSIISLIITLFIFTKINARNFFKECKINKTNPIFYICALLIAVGMLCGLGFVNDAITKWLSSLGVKVGGITVTMNNGWHLAMFLILLGVLPAVFEECFFRGILISNLQTKWYFSVMFIAVTFAIYHASLSQLVYQLIYGGVLAVLVYKCGSALPAMLAHFLNNAVVLVFDYVKVEIPYYNWMMIVFGLIALILGLVMLFVFGKEKNYQNGKKSSCWIYGSVGIVIFVALIVAGAIGV